MNRVEIELFRYRELLFGRVVHMDEGLRENLSVENDEFAIESVRNPALIFNTLFVRGTERSKDKRLFSYCFSSEEKAIRVAKNIESLLQKINGFPQDDTSNSVERLI